MGMNQQKWTVENPEPQDILCGKDRTCVNHEGTKRFRAVIDSYSQSYRKALTKYDKMTITREIFERMSKSSRFLKFNEDDNVWEELSATAARDKIGHSLRFASRTNKKRKIVHNRSDSFARSESSTSTEASTDSSNIVIWSRNGPATETGHIEPLPLSTSPTMAQINNYSNTIPLPRVPQSLDAEFDDLIESLDLDVCEGDPLYQYLNAPDTMASVPSSAAHDRLGTTNGNGPFPNR